MLLLHGGLGSIDMFAPNLPILAEHRLVIGIDLQGHGRTTLGEYMSKNRLAILPDLTHYEIFAALALGRTVLPFLDGKSGANSWADQVREKK